MISTTRFRSLTSRFPHLKILVVGDAILDRYVFGRVDRISPEAPVPILRVQSEDARPGGAGNVADNISHLGATAILVGIIGDDAAGRELLRISPASHRLITRSEVSTVTKTRVIAQRNQIVRIDREETRSISPKITEDLLNHIRKETCHGILVSDYAKGTVTSELMEGLITIAREASIPLIVDPKPANAHLYRGVTGVTPNLSETEAILGQRIHNHDDALQAARRLQHRLDCQFAIITRGEQGITAVEKRRRGFHIPALSHEVFDVTGAGDTAAALLILSLSASASLKEAVTLANTAASLVIEKVGTAHVTLSELSSRFHSLRI